MNAAVDVARSQILATVPPGPQQTALLGQLEVTRAQANAQINLALAAC
jgi:hypothetical protein